MSKRRKIVAEEVIAQGKGSGDNLNRLKVDYKIKSLLGT
jgi:hypothetical protein